MTPEEQAREIVDTCRHTQMPDVGEQWGACVDCITAVLAAKDVEIERLRMEHEAHRCSLPPSIQEALNSGDGTYRP